jgi:3-hydroxyanthranilate 3,4-dioxygenase
MVLKVVIEGSCRDIAIAEGELFLLPANVPHSPQRFENTVGLVLERTRASSEKDTLRWYMPGTYETILYQESFHCVDLGTQLKPVIERFFASEMYATKAPDQCYQAAQDLSIDASALKLPMNLAAISDRFENNCCSSILDSEFRVDIVKGVFDNNVQAKGSTVIMLSCCTS